MSERWVSSTRKSRLPRGWQRLRATILDRDGYRCTVTDKHGPCEREATEVDHIDRHGGDTWHNLASVCRAHHARKTAAEGNAAQLRQRRPAEPHPELSDDTDAGPA